MKKKIIIGVLAFFVLSGATCFIGIKYLKSTLINYYHAFNMPNVDSEYLKASGKVWGLDISHHQRKIKWNKMQGDNVPHFIFLKATEGVSHKDSKYMEYRKQANSKGILVGAYHFYRSSSGGAEQANEFIKYANLQKGNLIPVLDFESTGGQPKAKLKKELEKFIKVIEAKYGVKPIIYCDYGFAKHYIPDIDNMVIWASNFNQQPKCNYTFWQRTDQFKHPAFIGTVDYNEFKGEREGVSAYLIDTD